MPPRGLYQMLMGYLQRGVRASPISPSKPRLLPSWPSMNAADPLHSDSSHMGQDNVCMI